MSELIKSQQRLLKHAGFPCEASGVWDAASHAAMQGFSRTPDARPIAPRYAPLKPSDRLPANWRVVGSGLETRFELEGSSSVAGTVVVKPQVQAPPAFDPSYLDVTAPDLGPIDDAAPVAPAPEPEPVATEPVAAPAEPVAEPAAPAPEQAKQAAPFKKVR